jgi:hypothetical protein
MTVKWPKWQGLVVQSGRAGRQKTPNAGRQVNQEPLAEGDPVIVGQKEASSTTRV